MSNRRSGGGTRITEDDLNELVFKLQSLLPEARRRSMGRASASKLLKETCSYIKSLQREVGDLSDRLADLMSSLDDDGGGGAAHADLLRSLLR